MTSPNSGHPILGERRANPPVTLADIDAHIVIQMDLRFKGLEEKIDGLLAVMRSAVPDGNLEKHRLSHENWEKEAQERREFRQKVLVELAKGTSWAVVVAIGTALWLWFKAQVKS